MDVRLVNALVAPSRPAAFPSCGHCTANSPFNNELIQREFVSAKTDQALNMNRRFISGLEPERPTTGAVFVPQAMFTYRLIKTLLTWPQ